MRLLMKNVDGLRMLNALKRIENYFFETENLSVYKKTRNGLICSITIG